MTDRNDTMQRMRAAGTSLHPSQPERNLAQWLYINAGLEDCEKCDPDIVPPLYLRLARLMIKNPAKLTEYIFLSGRVSDSVTHNAQGH